MQSLCSQNCLARIEWDRACLVGPTATHSKGTNDWYWVMHTWRRTGLISVRIGHSKQIISSWYYLDENTNWVQIISQGRWYDWFLQGIWHHQTTLSLKIYCDTNSGCHTFNMLKSGYLTGLKNKSKPESHHHMADAINGVPWEFILPPTEFSLLTWEQRKRKSLYHAHRWAKAATY